MKMGRSASLLLLAILAACSQGAKTMSQGTPAPTPTNATGFPLYGESSVLTARDWRQTITPSAAGAAKDVYAQGAGTYGGHETIAQSSASMQQLESWLRELQQKPPEGYAVAVTGGGVDEARSRAQSMGIDFAAFSRTSNGKKHNVLVVALDPRLIDARAGAMIGLIGKYKMLPAGLRDPIDAQAKKQTGFTISEALSNNTPIGAALDAYDQLRSSGQRGIVVVDASKQ